MALTTTRDKGAIVQGGGGIIKISEVDDSGVEINLAPDYVFDLGYIQETTFSDTVDEEPQVDETRNTIQILLNNRKVVLSGVLMQSDKATLDIAKECRGKYYQVYYYGGIVNGKYQEFFFGICRIKPAVELNSLTRRVPLEITCLKNEGDINFVLIDNILGNRYNAKYPGVLVNNDYVVQIPAGEYYSIVETTV